MSSVIRFLEQMGRRAELRYAAKPALYKSLNENGVDQDAQWAILRGDAVRLEEHLGVRSRKDCDLFPPHPGVDLVEAGKREVQQAA